MARQDGLAQGGPLRQSPGPRHPEVTGHRNLKTLNLRTRGTENWVRNTGRRQGRKPARRSQPRMKKPRRQSSHRGAPAPRQKKTPPARHGRRLFRWADGKGRLSSAGTAGTPPAIPHWLGSRSDYEVGVFQRRQKNNSNDQRQRQLGQAHQGGSRKKLRRLQRLVRDPVAP